MNDVGIHMALRWPIVLFLYAVTLFFMNIKTTHLALYKLKVNRLCKFLNESKRR